VPPPIDTFELFTPAGRRYRFGPRPWRQQAEDAVALIVALALWVLLLFPVWRLLIW
jgi:hypothetical protein